MHSLPFVTSKASSDLLKEAAQLQELTDERWSVDWERFTLTCRHGVTLSHWAIGSKSPADLRATIVDLHSRDWAERTQPIKARKLRSEKNGVRWPFIPRVKRP